MKKIAILAASALVIAFLLVFATTAFAGAPHGTYEGVTAPSGGTDYCFTCHDVHQSAGDYVLMRDPTVTETCNTCHALYGNPGTSGPWTTPPPDIAPVSASGSTHSAYKFTGAARQSGHKLGVQLNGEANRVSDMIPGGTIGLRVLMSDDLIETEHLYNHEDTTSFTATNGLYCASCHTPHGNPVGTSTETAKNCYVNDPSGNTGGRSQQVVASVAKDAAGVEMSDGTGFLYAAMVKYLDTTATTPLQTYKAMDPDMNDLNANGIIENYASGDPLDEDGPSTLPNTLESAAPAYALNVKCDTGATITMGAYNRPNLAGTASTSKGVFQLVINDTHTDDHAKNVAADRLLSSRPNHSKTLVDGTAINTYNKYCQTCHDLQGNLNGEPALNEHNHPPLCVSCHSKNGGDMKTDGTLAANASQKTNDFPHSSGNYKLLSTNSDLACGCHTSNNLP